MPTNSRRNTKNPPKVTKTKNPASDAGLMDEETTDEVAEKSIFGEFCKKYLRMSKKSSTFAVRFKGKMAEWSIAAVLKTVDLNGSGGSNPSLSAKKNSLGASFRRGAPNKFF